MGRPREVEHFFSSPKHSSMHFCIIADGKGFFFNWFRQIKFAIFYRAILILLGPDMVTQLFPFQTFQISATRSGRINAFFLDCLYG